MKKGELKKKEIIRAAEMLFCRNGYDATGIQEILDELHTSKGSFYHHFVSKEALLEEICRIRARSSADDAVSLISGDMGPIQKLNALFYAMIPFNGEKLSFLLMILPVFRMSEGIHLRTTYGKALMDLYSVPVSNVLKEGTGSDCFVCRNPDASAEISLLLVNQLWMKVCDLILDNESIGQISDPAVFLFLIGQYRLAIEKLLGAPFGSLELIRLTDLHTLSEQIHLHWNKH